MFIFLPRHVFIFCSTCFDGPACRCSVSPHARCRLCCRPKQLFSLIAASSLRGHRPSLDPCLPESCALPTAMFTGNLGKLGAATGFGMPFGAGLGMLLVPRPPLSAQRRCTLNLHPCPCVLVLVVLLWLSLLVLRLWLCSSSCCCCCCCCCYCYCCCCCCCCCSAIKVDCAAAVFFAQLKDYISTVQSLTHCLIPGGATIFNGTALTPPGSGTAQRLPAGRHRWAACQRRRRRRRRHVPPPPRCNPASDRRRGSQSGRS